ncbi:MAG: hypothetical protein EA344_08670 [Alkalicoccus sp.]|uniref:Uncharacterized protein n=1 Tax=Alkalicoccus sp. TaxID=2005376 RepID=A0A651DSK5_9BACI|nr:MAG: hypothetical protein EA344_08670 [Alkalicoccus sp.]
MEDSGPPGKPPHGNDGRQSLLSCFIFKAASRKKHKAGISKMQQQCRHFKAAGITFKKIL